MIGIKRPYKIANVLKKKKKCNKITNQELNVYVP